MKKMKFIRTVTIILLAAVFTVSSYNVGSLLIAQQQSKGLYEEMLNAAVSTKDETENKSSTNAQEHTTEQKKLNIDFNLLSEKYKDIIGWVYSPDTVINYPVVKSSNNSYYVKHLPNGKKNSAGSIFADYRNFLPKQDLNYIIYGHNMKNNTMFGTLTDYKKQKYYDAHPVIYFITRDSYYTVELYAGYVTKSDSDAYTVEHTEESMAKYMEKIKRKSTFDSPVQYSEGDRILTLSTCSYETDNSRYVLVGIIR